MTELRWTDDVITPASREHLDVAAMVAELSTQPGRWAEVATYPPSRKRSARSRGSMTVKRYPELQYAVKLNEAGTYSLFFRVAPHS